MDPAQISLRMRMTVAALLTLYLASGCSLIMVGDPVQKQDISTQNDAEENPA